MHRQGVKLITAELAYDDEPFDLSYTYGDVIRVRGNSKRLCWQKESLLNIALRCVDTPKVAWVDADLTFLDPDWVHNTAEALESRVIIQPWSNAVDLGPKCEAINYRTSFMSRADYIMQRADAGTLGSYNAHIVGGHVGYAWAARADYLRRCGGLYDLAVIGSADQYMALALFGAAENCIPRGAMWKDELTAYQAKSQLPRNLMGYIPGTLVHHYHGTRVNRQFNSRTNILLDMHFDPATDISRTRDGLVEICRPELAARIAQYFSDRKEDE